MRRDGQVPIVNNATTEVTFVIQTASNSCSGTIILAPGQTKLVGGKSLTYETLLLRDSRGHFTDQLITMDELADDRLEKVEVTHNFKLVRHRRKTPTQKFFDWFKRSWG